MVQSFNPQGILLSFRAFLSPSLATPHLHLPSIAHISFPALKRAGIRAIAFDKDNTLTAPYADEIWSEFEGGWEECKRVFGRENVCVVSNSLGTPDDPNFTAEKRIVHPGLGVEVLQHTLKKPAGSDALLAHFSPHPPHTIAFVGDRRLTDVYYGNLGGLTTILTDAFSFERDNPVAKYVRRCSKRKGEYEDTYSRQFGADLL
ncbi:HAD-superfamily phosphatase [Saitoella complicata NRRL Y-17804]|uniref:HAD-superfamily phosphatase n=1 Tax=Saitoella complicata (strain BCRC 22490 / CBS 7301 / JCM 7358 / NBRC 10748 / NRRL Y-17804) TaxID=698492 RepID=UPI000867B2AA|nr:HAD-superfamily phosphatase [Saitoella complicata NRRL Y-17804]ODQ50472.1 HAD-superfamily phosphatase [Saitoella complicata NRRL Y-17804]